MKTLLPQVALTLAFILGLAGSVYSATDSAANSPVASTPEQVAPGVWRVHIGTPETIGIPSAFRAFPPDTKGLGSLPAAATCPLDATKIRSLVSARGLRVELPYDGENIYGLGLQGDTFEQQGLWRVLMNDCTVLNGLGYGHASFPYYVDAKGYAVLIDTARYVQMRIGTNAPKSHELEKLAQQKAQGGADATVEAGDDVHNLAEDVATDRSTSGKPFLVDVPTAKGVDLYVFAGPSMLSAVQRYNLYSGGGVLPPMWGLGVKYRNYSLASQDDVLKLAHHFRESQLPINVIGLEPGWQSHSYACSFVWNTDRFNRETLLAEFAKLNYRLDLWEHPYIYPLSPYYKDFYDKSGDFSVFGGLVPDLADPAALALYSKMHEALIKTGASSFKIDANDNLFQKGTRVSMFPDATQFPSGLDGEQTHQLFGVLTQQGVLKPFTDANLRTYSETRCSGPFAAPLPFTLFSDEYKQDDYYRMILTGGFCGLLWKPEIRRGVSFDEYYSRIQMAVLSPSVTFNNYEMPLPAWMQNDPKQNKKLVMYPDNEIKAHEDVMRVLLNDRMSLIPYLYSAFQRYQSEGLPPFRPLVLDYPDDPACAAIDDQVMIGDSLMGYVFLNKATTRAIYLPKGNWYDYNTGQKYLGGRSVQVNFTPTSLPLFVKENTILPLAKPVDHIDTSTVFELTCHVYGDAPVPFVLCEDDGETLDYKKGAQNRVTLTWTKADGGKIARDGSFSAKRYDVTAWTQVVEPTTPPAN